MLHTQYDLTLVPRTPRCADWDGDHHHERLPDREVHLGRPDGPFRPHNKRITMQQSSELFVLRPRASTWCGAVTVSAITDVRWPCSCETVRTLLLPLTV